MANKLKQNNFDYDMEENDLDDIGKLIRLIKI